MSSYQRLFQSSVASAVSVLVRIAQQLLIVAILLLVWSTELYGEWLIVSAIPVFLSLSDFGFVLAGSNELSRRAASESEKSVVEFYTVYSVFFQRWSLLIGFILALAAYALPLAEWLNLTVLEQQEVSAIFLLLCLGALVSQNSLALFAGLRARGKAHLGLWIRVFQAMAVIAVTVIVAGLLKLGPISLSLALFTVAIIFYLVEWHLLRRLGLSQKTNLFQRLKCSPDIRMSPYLGKGLEMMMIPLGQAIALQGSIVLVGSAIGPVAAAIFGTHRTFSRLSSSVIKIFSNPLLSEAGLLQRDEDKPLLTKIIVLLTRVTFWLALIMAAGYLLLGQWIYTIWVQGKVDFSQELLVVMLIGIIAESLWQIVTAVRMGSNRHRPVAWGFLIFSILGLLVAYILEPDFGVVGVAIGVTLIDVAMMVLAVITLRKVVNVSIFEFLRRLFVPPVKEIRVVLNRLASKSVKNAS